MKTLAWSGKDPCYACRRFVKSAVNARAAPLQPGNEKPGTTGRANSARPYCIDRRGRGGEF
jgi:hypothetical protein